MIVTKQALWRAHLLPVLAWTILCGLFFATILLGKERLPSGDLYGQFHAFALFQAREIADGRLPAWSPGSYAGIPFAADTQSMVYYPVRWLTLMLSLPWGFSPLALQAEAILHIWLAGVFTYALVYDITHEPLAGLLGAVSFALGGYLTSYPMLQLSILAAMTWLPLILLLMRRGAGRVRPVPWLIAAGLVLSVSLLAGHPQTFLHIGYVVAAYYFFITFRARWPWRWIVGLGAMIALVAIGVSTAALWPTLRFVPFTQRSHVSYDFVAAGLPMLDYIQIVLPGVLSLWSPQYIGLSGTLLAAIALFGRKQGQRGEVVFWAATAVAAAWLAMGDRGILFQLAYRLLPGVNMFRQQERLLGVFSLSCALLAAQGLSLVLQRGDRVRQLLVSRVAPLLAAALVISGLVMLAVSETGLAWALVWLRQWGMLAAALALMLACRRRRECAWLLVALLSVDLYVSTLGSIDRQPALPADYWLHPEWLEALASEAPSRIDSGGLFYANIGEIYGLEDVRGLSPLKPKAMVDLEQLPAARRWQLLNVTHVIAGTPPADAQLTPIAEITDGLIPDAPVNATLYRFDQALGRAWMSYRPVMVADEQAALHLLADPSFDPSTSVILQETGEGMPEVIAEGASSNVHVQQPGPGSLLIEVSTDRDGYLVISEWCYPGWQASLDGQAVPIYRANYALQAVLVPAGRHTVIVRFVPSLEGAALLASVVALLLAGLVAWRCRLAVAPRPPAAATQAALNEARPARELPWHWICAALILLAFALRVFRAWQGELSDDETFSYAAAKLPLAEIVPFLLRNGDPHSPFHYWLLHIWIRLAGRTEFAIRLGALMPGILLLPLAYQLGRRLADRRLPTLLVALLAASPSLVWVSQYARSQYTLAILFSVAATLILLRALDQHRWWLWACYAVACALTLYSHYYGFFALVGHGLYVITVAGRRRGWWPWLAGVSLAGLAFVPWLLTMWPDLTRAGQLSVPSRPDLADHLTAVGTELAVGRALGPQVGRWLFLLALMLCLAGAYRLWRQERARAALFAGWLGSAILGIYLVRFQRLTFNVFYVLVAAPAWWVLMAAGIDALARQGRRLPRILAAVSVIGLMAANTVSLWRYYFDPAQTRLGHRDVAQRLAVDGEPGDVFVANVPDSRYGYYLENLAMPQTLAPLTRGASAEQLEQTFIELADRYDRFWFVPAAGLHWDPQGLAYNWLEHNALLEQEATYYSQRLLAYRPLRTAEQAMMPVDLAIDGLIRLKGASITIDGRPAPATDLVLPAGAQVQVTLLWQTLVQPKEDYTVFVHLLGVDGRLVAQHDGTPVFGTRPASTWTAGGLLLDRHEFVVPDDASSDQASLLVGLYQSQTVARQTWNNGRDSIGLADVRLVAKR